MMTMRSARTEMIEVSRGRIVVTIGFVAACPPKKEYLRLWMRTRFLLLQGKRLDCR